MFYIWLQWKQHDDRQTLNNRILPTLIINISKSCEIRVRRTLLLFHLSVCRYVVSMETTIYVTMCCWWTTDATAYQLQVWGNLSWQQQRGEELSAPRAAWRRMSGRLYGGLIWGSQASVLKNWGELLTTWGQCASEPGRDLETFRIWRRSADRPSTTREYFCTSVDEQDLITQWREQHTWDYYTKIYLFVTIRLYKNAVITWNVVSYWAFISWESYRNRKRRTDTSKCLLISCRVCTVCRWPNSPLMNI